MTIQVFVQNEAGSHRKHYHNETTLEYLRRLSNYCLLKRSSGLGQSSAPRIIH
jgi:hypothetical protein